MLVILVIGPGEASAPSPERDPSSTGPKQWNRRPIRRMSLD